MVEALTAQRSSACPCRAPEKHSRRAIVNATLYLARTGCSWRQLSSDFPPWQTVYWHFVRWEEAKVPEKLLAAVREQLRVLQGRNPEPSAGLVDSRTVKGADTVGSSWRGCGTGSTPVRRRAALLDHQSGDEEVRLAAGSPRSRGIALVWPRAFQELASGGDQVG